VALLCAGALGVYFSVQTLPPITEGPPPLKEDTNRRENWIGQTGWAISCNRFVLVAAAYCVKRVVLSRCTRGQAIYLYSASLLLSLPYIWFLCEPGWFNPFLYRVYCWVGRPIALWFVPTVSFLSDVRRGVGALKRYLIRSGVEVLVLYPLWLYFWTFFSICILGWGWL
jgi:hypothetical protein